jgi:hypothetical protein
MITAAKKTIAVVVRAYVLLKGLNIFAKKDIWSLFAFGLSAKLIPKALEQLFFLPLYLSTFGLMKDQLMDYKS